MKFLPLIAVLITGCDMPEQDLVDEVKACTEKNLSAVVHVINYRQVAVYCLDDDNGAALCSPYAELHCSSYK